ncbi:transporter substrate-binding domain-containing protein [Succinivibrio dextrinosolvens]|uniref:transporter substrate-binding domain-containing protein n=1 Tax=Succinivibrio dextrinosolvens TaxID=83771 RepID=UPI00241F57E6|nr:transporter substrate-binding domain-containing protein [Succinivibrio dextrinosolvens]MBE6423399.1 transporter substrate-binding domain-containing protein [Succinivibrio dextrinosolvens]
MLLNKLSIITSAAVLVCSLVSSAYADESRLQRIKDNEELRVSVNNDLKILSLQDSKTGEYKGLEPSIAEMIAKAIDDKVNVTYITTTPTNRDNVLGIDYADCMIGTYTITEERKQKYDISSPYFVTNISILVKNKTNINSVKDLVGMKVGVIRNATASKELVKYMVSKGLIEKTAFEDDSFDTDQWNNQITFKAYDTDAAVMDALESNAIQAFCNDKIILESHLEENHRILKDEFAPQAYGIVTAKGSDLSPFIDALIEKWRKDGTLDKLIKENL